MKTKAYPRPFPAQPYIQQHQPDWFEQEAAGGVPAFDRSARMLGNVLLGLGIVLSIGLLSLPFWWPL